MKGDDVEPIWEGWNEAEDDDARPWRLVIHRRSTQRREQWDMFDPGAKAELEELLRNAPGVYPGAWAGDEEEPDEDE